MDATAQTTHGAGGKSARAQEPLLSEVWALMAMLFRQQQRRFLIAASELGLHPAQAGALLQLASPMPMHELAGLLACDNSNVTGLVDRLESRDLVARQASADDRRVKHVVLTAGGKRARAQLLARVQAPATGLQRLSTAEQRQLRDLLRRVVGEQAAAAPTGS